MAAYLLAGPAGVGGAEASGKVVFYADVANFVPGGPPYSTNLPSVRPKLVAMTEDGSYVINKLRWSSWGGRVARATGIASASNCMPSCAEGKRTNDKVRFVLSHRRHLFGHTVYACFQLINPKAPKSDRNDCLERALGSQYAYSPVAGTR